MTTEIRHVGTITPKNVDTKGQPSYLSVVVRGENFIAVRDAKDKTKWVLLPIGKN